MDISKIDDYTKASKIAVIQRNREKNKKPSKLDELRKLILGVKSKQIIESKKELIDVEEKEKKDIEQDCR